MMITEWPRSREAWQRARQSLPGGVATAMRASARPHPIYFAGGQGAVLSDIDGNEYIDYVLGWGPNILGYGNPRLVAAVSEQIERGATYGSGHHLEYTVAERLLERYPGMDRVLWSNTGTEADLVALRIARAATSRERIVKFGGHYHGWSDPMLVGYRPGQNPMGWPETLGQQQAAVSTTHVVAWGRLDELAALLEVRDDIAAVFLEPVLANSGLIEPPPGFLEGVRALCDRHGVILVFDEVITGLRIARGGAVERFGVTPDLVVLAKAVAAGLSLSAVLGKAEYLDLTLNGVVHAGTYNGNPLVLAAANAALTELDSPGAYERLEHLAARLADGFRSVITKNGLVGAVNQLGPIVQVALGIDRIHDVDGFLQADQTRYSDLLLGLLRRGVFAVPGGRWYLSTAHDEALVDETIRRFGEAFVAIAPQ